MRELAVIAVGFVAWLIWINYLKPSGCPEGMQLVRGDWNMPDTCQPQGPVAVPMR